MKTQSNLEVEPRYIGLDYHKRYSVYCAVDEEGEIVERGRIEHSAPEGFRALARRWPNCRLAFEASMNWCWLYDILEGEMPCENIVLANPYKTRIIAEAQIKTDSRPKGDSLLKAARRASGARQRGRLHPGTVVAGQPH